MQLSCVLFWKYLKKSEFFGQRQENIWATKNFWSNYLSRTKFINSENDYGLR